MTFCKPRALNRRLWGAVTLAALKKLVTDLGIQAQ